MPALSDIISEADVRLLVDRFYTRVQQDDLLSPIFNQIAKVQWVHHLPTMYDFWSSLLLGTSRYRGRPFPKHLPLPIDSRHFRRWLSLFSETVDAHFAGPVADEAIRKAGNLATIFEHRMQQAHNPLHLL